MPPGSLSLRPKIISMHLVSLVCACLIGFGFGLAFPPDGQPRCQNFPCYHPEGASESLLLNLSQTTCLPPLICKRMVLLSITLRRSHFLALMMCGKGAGSK